MMYMFGLMEILKNENKVESEETGSCKHHGCRTVSQRGPVPPVRRAVDAMDGPEWGAVVSLITKDHHLWEPLTSHTCCPLRALCSLPVPYMAI